MIVTKSALDELLAESISQQGDSRVCAIDTEADSLHRYSESLCLLQYSDGKTHELVDPLVIDDLSGLKTYLEDSVCWMHGADYDMHMLRTHLEVIPPTVYDTQIGARLLGVRKFGYGDLVSHYMGVELEKTSQKADWSKRPLTPVMEDYALNDVIYLLPMADLIVEQLKEKGRYDWFKQSCEAARQKALCRVTAKSDPWRIKGSGRLTPEGLNYLKALWYWRDSEAADWDKPSFMVSGNKQLFDWVSMLLEGERPSMPRYYRSSRVKSFAQAVLKAKEVPESDYPQRIRGERRKKDEKFEKKLDELMALRNTVAADLDIESSLIAARASLEHIAADTAEVGQVLLPWQQDLLSL